MMHNFSKVVNLARTVGPSGETEYFVAIYVMEGEPGRPCLVHHFRKYAHKNSAAAALPIQSYSSGGCVHIWEDTRERS